MRPSLVPDDARAEAQMRMVLQERVEAQILTVPLTRVEAQGLTILPE